MSYTKIQSIEILQEEADKSGLNPEALTVLKRIMHTESAGDTNATAKGRSSACGLFQATRDTWNGWADQLGLDRTDSANGDGRFDPKQQAIFGVAFTQHNEAALTMALGRKPSAGELYLAHFAGEGGAIKLLTAKPDTMIKDILSPDAITANGVKIDGKGNVSKGVRLNLKDGKELLFKDFTAGDIQVWANRKMEQPDGYETMTSEARAKYRKEHHVPDDAPDAFGEMVSFIGKILSAMVSMISSGVSTVAGMFSGSSNNSGNLPSPSTPKIVLPTTVAGIKPPSSNSPA